MALNISNQRLTYRMQNQWGLPSTKVMTEAALAYKTKDEKYELILKRLADYEDIGTVERFVFLTEYIKELEAELAEYLEIGDAVYCRTQDEIAKLYYKGYFVFNDEYQRVLKELEQLTQAYDDAVEELISLAKKPDFIHRLIVLETYTEGRESNS